MQFHGIPLLLWIMFAALAVAGAVLTRRRSVDDFETEPWRRSLDPDPDAPLDIDEIREAEEEWLREEPWSDEVDDEPWR